ncbi:MAG: rod shape-determining protein MreC [Parcubacteria group bacterium]|nr:rod shape-determining protein MreC [Parcubacteria group bacterium]
MPRLGIPRSFVVSIAVVLGIGVLILGDTTSVFAWPKGVFLRLIAPLVSFPGEFGRSLERSLGGENELDRLRGERGRLRAEIAQSQEVALENRALRTELALDDRPPLSMIDARVVGRDPSGVRQFLVVDRGADDGVQERDLVILPGRILLGRVVSVGPRTAEVLLIFDPESAVNVRLQQSRVTGILRGEFGLGLRVERIPTDTTLAVGEAVITSGTDGFAGGIFVGEVREITKSDTGLFSSVRVASPVNVQELETVFMVRPASR